MKRHLAIVALAALPFAALADDDRSTRAPVNDLAWLETGFGPLASPVDGDFSKGGHITLIKFTGGLATPVHTHDHDYIGLVLTGTTRHYIPGKPETQVLLPAGSHWFIPGAQPHISECMTGSDCIMAIIQKDAMNFEVVE